jgi:hypothetical protein
MSTTKINTTTFPVERYVARPNVEPTNSKGRPTLYPFQLMARGDSFEVPNSIADKMRAAARMYAKKHTVTFEYESNEDTTRVWRTR